MDGLQLIGERIGSVLPTVLIVAESFFVAVGAASLIWMIYSIMLLRKLNTPEVLPKGAAPKLAQQKEWFLEAWGEVTNKLAMRREADWKAGLVLACDLMDRVLARSDIQGGDLGAKLARLDEAGSPGKKDLLEAWSLCQRFSKNTGTPASKEEIQRAIEAFRQAFEAMGLFE